MIYKIYEDFFNDVEKKLKRIGKKCAKHGNPFTFEVVGNEISEVENEETGRKEYYKFIIVEVEGTAKINDYECVAILENHEHGNIIRRINNEIDIPERFMHTENFCEHCNSKRRRKELYIIHNTKTNEFKQVGSNCLMLYTNGLNAEYVASYIDGITELEEFSGRVGGHGRYYIPVDEVLGYATEIINKMGYFNSNSNCPTKHLVLNMLYRNSSLNDKIYNINKTLEANDFRVRFNSTDFYKDNTEKFTEEVIKYYLENEDGGEFINNVKVILKEGYVEYHNVGYLCYLPEGYSRYIEKENQKAKQIENEISEHFGEVGKRYKDLKVYNSKILTSYETMFGTCYVYKFVLESGNVLIWKSSNWYEELENADKEIKNITFTVKSHSEFNNLKQTEVTRCKLNIE